MVALRLCIYTSSVGISLQRVSMDVARVLSGAGVFDSIDILRSPSMDYRLLEGCDACMVVMPFDMVWAVPYMLVAWWFWWEEKPYIVYTTIEGSVKRELVRGWIIRDLSFVANSLYTKEKLEEVNARVSAVVYHGVDINKVLSFSYKREEVREYLGVGNKVLVGYIAQGHARKCHNLFAQVIKEVRKLRNDVEFLVLTDSDGAKNYEGVEAIVLKDFGTLPEEAYYGIVHAIDVYTQASCSEGFGIPVVEALAAGKPVVHPSYNPLNEITTPECSARVPVCKVEMFGLTSSGIVFELRRYRPEVFARALLGVINSMPSNYSAMSRAASARAAEFDYRKVYRFFVEYFSSALRGSKA